MDVRRKDYSSNARSIAWLHWKFWRVWIVGATKNCENRQKIIFRSDWTGYWNGESDFGWGIYWSEGRKTQCETEEVIYLGKVPKVTPTDRKLSYN